MAQWLDNLEEEDLAFIRRFILASGSLKELAGAYGVSYPTVRLRLDRLIEKIKIYEDLSPASAFEKRLRAAFSDGRLDAYTMKSLLQAHQEDLEAQND